jgi:hypothetical protein
MVVPLVDAVDLVSKGMSVSVMNMRYGSGVGHLAVHPDPKDFHSGGLHATMDE